MVRNYRPTERRRRWWRGVALVILLLVTAHLTVARAQSRGPNAAGMVPGESEAAREYTSNPVPAGTGTEAAPVNPGNWPRLQLADPVARQMARAALDLAWQRLGQPGCGAVLNGFNDPSGRPLDRRLATLSVDVQTYLTMLVFIDGTRERPCMTGVLAFTSPGSRVIRICVDQLKQAWQQAPDHTTANVIHEMLHTLGLSENPPSSAAITSRVLAACFRRR
jgi:hypothetical protein